MKKVIISIIILAAAAAGVLILVNGNFFDKKTIIDSSSTPEEIVSYYANAVENSKNNINFTLDVATSVELKNINSSAVILNTMLEGIIGYQVGDVERNTEKFTFSNGVSLEDSELTPLDIIQPEGINIESVNYNSISSATADNQTDSVSVSFEIADETANLDSVLEAINPIIRGEVTNSSALMKLTPYHSKFIDVDDVFATVTDMIGVNNLIGSNKSTPSSDSSSKAIEILSGECSIGKSQIIADINENNCLNKVTMKIPVEFHAVIKFMNRNIDTVIQIEVLQQYSFGDNS
ncbi:MAG: hypothetical protein K2G22_05865 [Eubacterium sp.]|nr:hypothetical protein [Eubacterium sp.]